MGSATSIAFYLPFEINKITFKRSGGANAGSGFYLHLNRNSSVICSSENSVNTNAFSTDSCMNIARYAGEAVYISLVDLHRSLWGKVLIDDIRLKDRAGADIRHATAIPSPWSL
mmetsp:Transcript_67145/g.190427  ORF Transcript_67145/g.190427 Transcript_67145/m.190427 type:complete len:114 (+) Transcript_67145:111-452(+)